MRDPSDAMQVALFAKLTTHAAMTGFPGGAPAVYDKVPTTPAYPCIRIGEDQILPRSTTEFDGWDFVATLHIFSRHMRSPRAEAKQISDAILQALATKDEYPTPAGFVVKGVELGSSRVFMESDGLTAHGVVVVEYLVRPA